MSSSYNAQSLGLCLKISLSMCYIFSSGDYRDCTIVIWSTTTYCILTTSKAASPIHELKWDPYTVNEFSSVGQNGTMLFWLLDETTSSFGLNVHEAEVPDDLLYSKSTVSLCLNLEPYALICLLQ